MYITYKTAMQLYDLGFHSFWQDAQTMIIPQLQGIIRIG